MSLKTTGELPLSAETVQVLANLDHLQLAWLSGYAWAKAQSTNSIGENFAKDSSNLTALVASEPLKVTVLSASQTGNAKSVADKLAERLTAEGVNVVRTSLKDYKAKNIADEQLVLLVTSTQGEGEAPEEGVVLLKLLNGKKAPKLDRLQFAVLGLGDSSYPNFCQAGKDFDQRFYDLGATRLFDRVDADLDFQATADQWINEIVEIIKAKNNEGVVANLTPNASQTPVVTNQSKYNKANPFPATLITNQRITAKDAEKDVRHLEFDLSGSGLSYQSGDVLGVYFENDPALVNEILTVLSLSAEEQVTLQDKTLPLATALQTQFELTQNTAAFVKHYAALANHTELNTIVTNSEQLQNFVQNTPLVDVINSYPADLSADQLLALLRPLTPRLYSIASAQSEVGEEVHLSVGVVRYDYNGKARAGAASSYLADRVEEDGQVRIFVEHNDNFKLPQDSSKPIIMIGSGTGIAPFRSFVQQRATDEAEGKNWLIFGNQHFASDFLYQTEWQQFAKDGFLHKYSFAWSRDQEQKIYVQDKIREEAETLWQWLQQGAYLYVCGDASRMAKDVNQALLDVIAQQGNLNADEAEEYLDNLREEKRYQRDVY
ncbi:assimilatory sulfite reductase (NADPH) flavoprotein subunit [Actinobacillus pleuropneumoniae]|uniref:Sulfite reductase [NADPH] flavoprotein alpha-component n=1 Tax=Actinobacillus pleuropneumoniae serotype 7 (strain AP76) TaxID=537457 RepID=B3GZ96_ACTP7|nr:assimilatory sulfite reductase (NADPH) flavoprotein subunit [Actinobacillus pleuropneumoniae]ACE62582.1 Sulfite reductase [NADPH] flavoprotein alpha- component (SIR-FP) [Actinobacillus pleuropneumoniae serovar 7 str. AP76]EFN01839.1 Sulfite reductase [NADPH] flavoprotein alpha-component [Actinobacillus pleuropneumoniae serovar 13 str. N273]UKH39986.1 assimilatory sulfite reductase (NADPH) flavoprotein subunit [Actinobacillus pleuropneumoniae]UQZ25599.1 assimilatory sulfite reductase (NADPH) 